jgi:hypothetical protein
MGSSQNSQRITIMGSISSCINDQNERQCQPINPFLGCLDYAHVCWPFMIIPWGVGLNPLSQPWFLGVFGLYPSWRIMIPWCVGLNPFSQPWFLGVFGLYPSWRSWSIGVFGYTHLANHDSLGCLGYTSHFSQSRFLVVLGYMCHFSQSRSWSKGHITKS